MQEIIFELKKKYDPLFCTQIGNEYYIWRLLTRAENRRLADLGLSELDMEDVVCSICVLYPEVNWQYGKAGVAKTLFPIIYDESGFGDTMQSQYLYEYYRQQLETDKIKQAEIMINIAFPEITIEEMATWDAARLWRKVAEAEYKINNLNKIHTIPGYTIEINFNTEKEEVPTRQEITQQMRDQGIDPMLTVNPPRWDKGYLDFPFIVGPEDFIYGIEWEDPYVNEGLFNEVQRQLLERKYRWQSRASRLPKS